MRERAGPKMWTIGNRSAGGLPHEPAESISASLCSRFIDSGQKPRQAEPDSLAAERLRLLLPRHTVACYCTHFGDICLWPAPLLWRLPHTLKPAASFADRDRTLRRWGLNLARVCGGPLALSAHHSHMLTSVLVSTCSDSLGLWTGHLWRFSAVEDPKKLIHKQYN